MQIVVELLEHGIDKTIVGLNGRTAAELARSYGNQGLATLIEDHDYIDPGMPSMKGMLNQKYQVNGSNLTFNNGVQEDGFGKFALKTNYSFYENANLFFNVSAKKTTEEQETYSLSLGSKLTF